jgi:hypothetical protein
MALKHLGPLEDRAPSRIPATFCLQAGPHRVPDGPPLSAPRPPADAAPPPAGPLCAAAAPPKPVLPPSFFSFFLINDPQRSWLPRRWCPLKDPRHLFPASRPTTERSTPPNLAHLARQLPLRRRQPPPKRSSLAARTRRPGLLPSQRLAQGGRLG